MVVVRKKKSLLNNIMYIFTKSIVYCLNLNMYWVKSSGYCEHCLHDLYCCLSFQPKKTIISYFEKSLLEIYLCVAVLLPYRKKKCLSLYILSVHRHFWFFNHHNIGKYRALFLIRFSVTLQLQRNKMIYRYPLIKPPNSTKN